MSRVWLLIRSILSISSVSALLFLCLNALLWKIDREFPFSSLASNAQHFDFSETVNGFNRFSHSPQILLMGSSLLLYPSWIVDRQVDTKCGDPNHYHLCKGLEKACIKLGANANISIYDLSIGGGMKSDDYFLLSKYVIPSVHPGWIIVDCAPRSFYDSGMINGKDSPIFQYLSDLSDFAIFESGYLPGITNKLDFLFSHTFFLWYHRRYLQDQFLSGFKLISQFLNPSAIGDSLQFTNKIAMKSNVRKDTMQNSLVEYANRYRGISIVGTAEQMKFFDRFLKLCSSNSIKVLVVNMPLTVANRKLLPTGFYDTFSQQISTISKKDKAAYLDLSNTLNFTDEDFADSAHLNVKGGQKLFEYIAGLKLFSAL